MRQTTMPPVGEAEIYLYLYGYKCRCIHCYVRNYVDAGNSWGRTLSVPMHQGL
jgi:hypothetical protein